MCGSWLRGRANGPYDHPRRASNASSIAVTIRRTSRLLRRRHSRRAPGSVSFATWKTFCASIPSTEFTGIGPYPLGHARGPTEENAHPHATARRHRRRSDGIVKFLPLRTAPSARAIPSRPNRYRVIAHLVEKHFAGNLESAGPRRHQGAPRCFRAGRIEPQRPEQIVAGAKARPSWSASAKGEYLRRFRRARYPEPYAGDMFFLADGDMAVLTRMAFSLCDFDGRPSTDRSSTSSGTRLWPKRAATSTSCSRKYFEQAARHRDTTSGASVRERAHFLDKMDIRPKQFQSFKRSRSSPAEPAGTPRWRQIHDRESSPDPVEVDYGSESAIATPLFPRTS